MGRKKRYEAISKDILRLRHELGESRKQFAKHFSVTRTTIINWETYAPPAYGPTRLWCEHVMYNLWRRIKRRRAAERQS